MAYLNCLCCQLWIVKALTSTGSSRLNELSSLCSANPYRIVVFVLVVPFGLYGNFPQSNTGSGSNSLKRLLWDASHSYLQDALIQIEYLAPIGAFWFSP